MVDYERALAEVHLLKYLIMGDGQDSGQAAEIKALLKQLKAIRYYAYFFDLALRW